MSFLGVCKGDDAGKAIEEHFLSAPCMRRYHFVLIPGRVNAVWEAGPYYLTPDSALTFAFQFPSAAEQCTELRVYRESVDMALNWGCRLKL